MTLISCTKNYNNPILLGDLLITSTQKEDESKLPTYLQGIEKYFPKQGNFPVKLRQKIYIINDQLCLGLSGNLLEMKAFLDDITQYFKYHKTSIQNIDTFLQDYINTDINYVILTLDNDYTTPGFYIYHQGTWESADLEAIENVLANGSGAKEFISRIDGGWKLEGYGDLNGLSRALAMNYSVLGNILSVERFSLETIKESWGAGFELIYFDEKFLKMDDITYVIWNSKYENNKFNEPMPIIVLNFKYYDDILVISSHDQKGLIELTGVLPIYKNAEDIDRSTLPTKPHFDSLKICSVFIFQHEDDTVFTPTIFSESNGKDWGVCKAYFNEDEKFQIIIQSDVQEHLVGVATEMLNKNFNL